MRLYELVESKALPNFLSRRMYTADTSSYDPFRTCSVAQFVTTDEAELLKNQWQAHHLLDNKQHPNFDLAFVSFRAIAEYTPSLRQQVQELLITARDIGIPVVIEGEDNLEVDGAIMLDLGAGGLGLCGRALRHEVGDVMVRDFGKHDAFETLSLVDAGHLVISPTAVPEELKEIIFQASSTDEAEELKNFYKTSQLAQKEDNYRAKMAGMVSGAVWHQVNQILAAAGVQEQYFWEPTVGILGSTNRPHKVQHLLTSIANQRGVRVEPHILTHGFEPSTDDKKFAEDLGLAVRWSTAPSTQSLGENYNQIIGEVEAEFVSKFDDDDSYGPYFLLENISALIDTNAALVGKRSHAVVLEYARKQRQALRFPERARRWERLVSGATMSLRTQTAQEFLFSAKTGGEDTDLQRRILDSGLSIWSTSEFGYVQNRTEDDHSWDMDTLQMFKNAELLANFKASSLLGEG